MSMIEIKNLKKSFDNLEVLKSIDFHVDKGEVITLIGASGSGKSTLLRCINLLEIPDGGEIFPPSIACSRKAPIKAFAARIKSFLHSEQSSPWLHRKSVVLLICNAIQSDSIPGRIEEHSQNEK